MKVSILMGSMNKNGNTSALLKPFINQLRTQGISYDYLWLKDYKFEACKSCFKCQNIDNESGCSINDEMGEIFKSILDSECVIFASPIYTWFCTVPMKIVLDRLFCMNKFYGNTQKKYSLLEGKKIAIAATCGYEIEKGADLFEEAVKRFAEHSCMDYIGMLAIRDINGISDFETKDVINLSKDFAIKIYGE